MPVFRTETLTPGQTLPPSVGHQIYCGLDNCITREVLPVLDQIRADSNTSWSSTVYDFERQLQGPYLEMMTNGFLTDSRLRQATAAGLRQSAADLQSILDELAYQVWDQGLNPRSPTQLQKFFYSKMRLPEIWLSQKGERKLSTNREAMEKLEQYIHARPFISLILAIRDKQKQAEVLETSIDPDGRFRSSFNIAGTETGRPSSSENAFGTGGNAQNIAPGLRHVFIASPGYKLCQIDLEQVEARDVGYFCGNLFSDWSFLDACESGDLHTANARLIWPELAWTGSLVQDRKIADGRFYREFSYRDMAKRGSHLSNYSGTAWTMSRALKIPIQLAEEFQARYVRGRGAKVNPEKPWLTQEEIRPAYPCIAQYWQWIAQQIQTSFELVTPFGFRRHFFGRTGDDTTLREAIAFLPQSTTATRVNLGLWRCWRHMPQIRLLSQGFDSITFEYPDQSSEAEGQIISEAMDLMRVELTANNGRKYIVPGEAKIGWNWGNQTTAKMQAEAKAKNERVPELNLDGLVKWQPDKPDLRQRTSRLETYHAIK